MGLLHICERSTPWADLASAWCARTRRGRRRFARSAASRGAATPRPTVAAIRRAQGRGRWHGVTTGGDARAQRALRRIASPAQRRSPPLSGPHSRTADPLVRAGKRVDRSWTVPEILTEKTAPRGRANDGGVAASLTLAAQDRPHAHRSLHAGKRRAAAPARQRCVQRSENKLALLLSIWRAASLKDNEGGRGAASKEPRA